MPVRHRNPTATSSTMINSPPPSSMSSEPLLPEDSSASGSSNTISHDESLRTVPWQTDNDSVMTGYRRQLYSVKACLWSSVSCELKIHVSGKTAHPDFADLHNETGQLNQYLQGSRKLTAAVNIHSHSFGAICFAILLPLHLVPTHFPTFFASNPVPTPPTMHDKVALSVNLICAVGCLSLSSWFHTVQCHSKAMCDSAHRGDYVGIPIHEHHETDEGRLDRYCDPYRWEYCPEHVLRLSWSDSAAGLLHG